MNGRRVSSSGIKADPGAFKQLKQKIYNLFTIAQLGSRRPSAIRRDEKQAGQGRLKRPCIRLYRHSHIPWEIRTEECAPRETVLPQ